MCGICGIVASENRLETAECVARMMRAMVHRGPDGEGIFVTSGAGIGMRRLSIIDIPGGQQPIWNEAETLAIVFNGEIYNFRELRQTLQGAGHTFRTSSDTETIVHAYEEWGRNCVQQLHGMFAFAILEMPQGKSNPASRLFLARDRMGIKPLYYGFSEGKFFFASEVRALLSSGCFPRRLFASAVSAYLSFGAVGEPNTLIEGIHSVPPGYSGYVSCEGVSPKFEGKPYWTVTDATKKLPADSNESPPLRIRAALQDSVRRHLLADVPLGVFLSSGIDSTAVAALASKEKASIKTFTVAFSEESFSEGAEARAAAKYLGTDHSELLLTADEMRLRVDEAVAAFDQPSADGINTYFVSWAARQAGLKVALSGLGSDEIFGGYSTFSDTPRLASLMAASRYVPPPLRSSLSRILLSISNHVDRPDAFRKAIAAFRNPSDFSHPYFYTRMLFAPVDVARLLRNASNDAAESEWRQWLCDAAEETANLDDFTSVSWLETRSYLVDMLLRDTDTMSMCHSLEVRVPFLDDEVVRTALSCPQAVKCRNGIRKPLLIEALGDLLPPCAAQHTKRTFTLPWKFWLRGPLRATVQEGLSNCDPSLAEVIDIVEVKRVWDDFLAERTSWSRPWSIFVLSEWAKRNLAEAPAATMPSNTWTAASFGS
jgi:asparagine synthase (glutamine-hydrolysing)